MTEAKAGDFVYSLASLSAQEQKAAIEAQLQEDPTFEKTMSFALWQTHPRNKNAFVPAPHRV